MSTDWKTIRISVRNLVEFVMRSGDIDNRRTSSAQKRMPCRPEAALHPEDSRSGRVRATTQRLQ